MTVETMQQVVRALARLGTVATLEYPGYIDVPINDGTGHSYTFGDANAARADELGAQRMTHDGSMCIDDPLFIDQSPYVGSVARIAREIHDEVTAARGVTVGVSVACGASDGFLCTACALATPPTDDDDETAPRLPITQDHVRESEMEGEDGDFLKCDRCGARLYVWDGAR